MPVWIGALSVALIVLYAITLHTCLFGTYTTTTLLISGALVGGFMGALVLLAHEISDLIKNIKRGGYRK